MQTASRTRCSRLTSVLNGDCKAILLRVGPLSSERVYFPDLVYWRARCSGSSRRSCCGLGGSCHAFGTIPAVLRWAGDAEGGAPYVEADPADPSRVVGFDVEVAELIAQGLGREPRFVEVAFASIDQSIARGDADIGLSGIEDTPARRAGYAVTASLLSVPRGAERPRCRRRTISYAGRSCAAAASARSAARSPTRFCSQAERDHGIVAVSYEDDVHPYSDLLIGRLDAVLLDNVLAERRSRTTPGFVTQPSRSPCRTTSAFWRRATRRFAIGSTSILQRGDEGRPARGDLQEVEVWNDDQPSAVCAGARGRRPSHR